MIPLEDALDDCLEQLENSTATVDQCLARYPQHAAELLPMLTASAQFEPARAVTAPPSFKTRNRAQLIAYMGEHPRGRKKAASPFFQFFQSGFKVAFSLGTVAVALLVISTTAAQAAMPGEALYGLKRTSEGIWRVISPDPLSVDLALNERRAEELMQAQGTDSEAAALQDYEASLVQLNTYTDPDDQQVIANRLSAQQEELQENGLVVPTLEQLLTGLDVTISPTEILATLIPTELPVTIEVPVVATLIPELPIERPTRTQVSPTRTAVPTSTNTNTAAPPPVATNTPVPVLPLPTLPLPVPTLELPTVEVPPVVETVVAPIPLLIPSIIPTVVGGVGDVVQTVVPERPPLFP
jgi:hypothetical protein